MEYNKAKFHTAVLDATLLTNIKNTLTTKTYTSILDVGCGSGELLHASLEFGQSLEICVGVDISEQNTTAASKKLQNLPNLKELSIICCDYMQQNLPKVDLIVSSSTLHLINAPTKNILSKVAQEVNDGGRIIFTVPIACTYNTLLICVRKILRMVDCKATRFIIKKLARIVFPSINEEIIEERIPYMFIIPKFTFSKRHHIFLESKGMKFVSEEKTKYIFGKPQHSVFIYEK